MDRKTQIEFIEAGDSRVRSYVSKWLDNTAVCNALERRPADDGKGEPPPLIEPQRKVG